MAPTAPLRESIEISVLLFSLWKQFGFSGAVSFPGYSKCQHGHPYDGQRAISLGTHTDVAHLLLLVVPALRWHNCAMLTPFVHQATLVMSAEDDLDAPGAAVTLKLCGSLDHEPPCRVPHHTHAERAGTAVVLRIVFAAEPVSQEVVRHQIDEALRVGSTRSRAGESARWEFGGSVAAELSRAEAALGRRLAGP